MSSAIVEAVAARDAAGDAAGDAQEPWRPALAQQCDFQPAVFCSVMMNLIKNPNINSTHLFRADILYDSLGELDKQVCYVSAPADTANALPRAVSIAGFSCRRTLVRLLIP